MLLTNGAYAIFFASHILHLLLTLSVRSQTNQPPVSSLIQQRRLKLFGHMARAAASEDHSRALRSSTDQASLLTGAVQEADLVSPGFEQSRVISNCSTLEFTVHCSEQRSFFLATHRGNGSALRARHLMMMMIAVEHILFFHRALHFIVAKHDGRAVKRAKAAVKFSPPTNQHPAFYRPDVLPDNQSAVSELTWGLPSFLVH